MDTQIDHAAGMPIDLLGDLPSPVDVSESLFSTLQEPLAQGQQLKSSDCP
jgi:hypothetical protein